MSSFLSATENVARQCQNVRRDLKKDGGISWRWRVIFYFWFVLYRKNVSITVRQLHGPSMFAVKAKIYGLLYNQASSITFDETSSYWSALKSS